MKRVLLLLLIALCAFPLAARVGGGESFSGGGSSGGGDSGDGLSAELIFWIIRFLWWLTLEYPAIGIPVDIIVLVLVIRFLRRKEKPAVIFQSTAAPVISERGGVRLDALRRFDPNFSEVVFRDFVYSLYARVHYARGEGKLEQYVPYLSSAARTELARRGGGKVENVIVGALEVGTLTGIDSPQVAVDVTFDANMTEGGTSWYVRERWWLERQRDILSPEPAKAKADHCPRCGAPLQTRTDGACGYCGVKIEGGTFHWYVRTIQLFSREDRGPLLTSNVPEQGTESATVWQPRFHAQRDAFLAEHPDFSWDDFDQRVREIAKELQDAWSARDWERVRPLETEGLFQQHRYWIDAYRRQRLRNVVDAFAITRIEAVKVDSDAFYEAITVRIFARGADSTVDESGNVVAGSDRDVRTWSEYWTFIRTKPAAGAAAAPPVCPNCGAEVAVGATGVCTFCGGKLTSGTFDWVLSRIEQDEVYEG